MKEFLVGETYNKSYVAIPVTESSLFNWVQSINGNKKFYHITVLLFGKIFGTHLAKVNDTISNLPLDNNGVAIIPEKLGFIGERDGLFVLRIKKTDQLENIREILENTFPENNGLNHDFLPHITIKRARRGEFNKHDRSKLLDIYDRSVYLEPFEARTIGLYYRTEEGATALLCSKKT